MKDYFKNSYKSETHNLPLSVKNVGSQKCTPSYHWGPGVRDHFLLHYVISGCGIYTVEGRAYPVSAGQAFLARPGELISYEADKDEPWEYYWIGFAGSEAKILLERSGFERGAPVISIDFGKEFCENITNIYDARGHSPDSRARMLGYTYLLLARLCESDRAKDDSDAVGIAEEFFRNNFSRQITITDAAEYSGVSRSWLYRGFMEKYACSPNEFLQRLRMDYAANLLLETELSIGEAAYSAGYIDPLYFTKVFAKRMGCSPSEYRKRNRRVLNDKG